MDINTQVILEMKKRHEENAKPKQPEQKRVRKAAKPANKGLSDTEEAQEAEEYKIGGLGMSNYPAAPSCQT